jgi:choline-sulfatase
VFYDESARVPFIVSQKGRTRKGESDVLVNTGVDMIPTLCDFAGITPPPHLPGRSLKAPALGKAMADPRAFVVTQHHMVQCAEVDGKHLRPHGRMVRSEHYKYCLYSEGKRRESLVDMVNDPGEMVNLADDPDYRDVLIKHRACLKQHARQYEDETALRMLESVGVTSGSIARGAHP